MTAPNKTPDEVELEAVEASLVAWKRREKDYGSKGIAVPQHVTRRIQMLKQDARQLRADMNREASKGE